MKSLISSAGVVRKLRPYKAVTAAVLVSAALLDGLGSGPAAAKITVASTAPTGRASTAPETTCPSGGQCFADVSSSNGFYDFINRIYQQDLVSGYVCGGAGEPCDAEGRPYYRPGNTVTRQQMAKFIDNARRLPGIDIEISSGVTPIYARNDAGTAISARSTTGQALVALTGDTNAIYAQSGNSTAIYGFSTGGPLGIGVYGTGDSAGIDGNSPAGIGVRGISTASNGIGTSGRADTGPSAVGVYGGSDTGVGVLGYTTAATGAGLLAYGTNGGDAVYGIATTSSGNAVRGYNNAGGSAGYFQGNVNVTGSLSKGAGSFKIDDPIDPENRYLYHSFVESPDMMNVYNGNVKLDAGGEATVVLPDWFEALNRDYRYQLTAIGAPGPNLYIAEKVKGNTFRIAGGTPGTEVSWQVTGIRQDPYANAHRIPVEEDKSAQDKGKYLHPTEWGQPESKGIDYISPEALEQRLPQYATTGK